MACNSWNRAQDIFWKQEDSLNFEAWFRRAVSDAASFVLYDALTMFLRRPNLEKISVTENVSFSTAKNEN